MTWVHACSRVLAPLFESGLWTGFGVISLPVFMVMELKYLPPFIHSLIHSLVRSLVHSLVLWFIHTYTHTHTHRYIYMYTYIHTSMHALFTHTQILSAYQDNQVGVWGNLWHNHPWSKLDVAEDGPVYDMSWICDVWSSAQLCIWAPIPAIGAAVLILFQNFQRENVKSFGSL